ncbi:hypothetical protein TCAL_13364 [Tigriopus californicus]|uniref:CCAAT-binding factor domain-containing protein n=1 Tax=Tigriopus californicus TaxID=6832 RepID=A0A553N951_TIGCA|nr:nucleolar complex protein 4 homolog [Tigriopus californicus]TRY61909.1 hypothetical protein TCAL_13364 [Tigriopus californicus]|eukprot:TCALIF_13364-PA protein Name:"Similar to Noc4l Nucleolar complex protein 4 homolog (Rattus norvegicus)" AED:0.00 eAED:0.01 QI:0/-1/0/1/-1/1/1/0/544
MAPAVSSAAGGRGPGGRAGADSIRQTAHLIRQDPRQLNQLLDLVDQLDHSVWPSDGAALPVGLRPRVIATIQACTDILLHYQARGDLTEPPPDSADPPTPAQQTLLEWWRQRTQDIWQALLALVTADHPLEAARDFALVALMRLLQLEPAPRPKGRATTATHWSPVQARRFKSLILALCQAPRSTHRQIQRCQEFLEFVDVQQQALHTLAMFLKSALKATATPLNQITQGNVMSFLEVLNFRQLTEKDQPRSWLCQDQADRNQFPYAYPKVRQTFSEIWERFLKLNFDLDLYKRVLIIMDEKIMAHLTRPLLLTDFLINSYHVGGPISILALNGVFTLIQNYHLEYPDFYQKLYALLQPDILHAKYRARFFYMADIFLTSTHLPEYLVAAFAKRLARLTLTAPAPAFLMILPFIGNLLLRHKSLLKLLHGQPPESDEPAPELESDPYRSDEPDPAQCRALDSCLWEIQTLQHHALPQVSQVAKTMFKKLPEMEWDLSQYLDITIDDMMTVETKKTIFVNVPLNFERPTGLKFPKNDLTDQIFAL